jgi:hypothetical protein
MENINRDFVNSQGKKKIPIVILLKTQGKMKKHIAFLSKTINVLD